MSAHRLDAPPRGRIRLADGSEIPVTVAETNPHSLVVTPETPPAAGLPTGFDEATLWVGDREVRLGAGRLEPDPSGDRLRLVCTDALFDFGKLLRSGTLLRVEDRFRQLPLLLGYKESVRPEFARWVADLSYDLRVYKMLLDEIDAGLAGESAETRDEVRRRVLESQGKSFMLYLDSQIERLGELVSGFSRHEHEQHGFYLRRQLWDLLLTSPFLARTNLRPRGYAGDSIMMQQIYRDEFEGETLFGQILHKHPISSKAAQAVRNRRVLVPKAIREMRQRLALPDDTPLRFLSVACGPAWELRDVYREPEDLARYHATLLDQDREALAEAKEGIEALQARLGHAVPARLVRESVRTMLRSTNLPSAWGRFHVIYSMGLFDYLNARVARVVLHRLYTLLEPGGLLLVGNFHPQNHTRHYMAYFMDWMLVYRTEDEFVSLADLCRGATCSLTFEDTRSQMFLSVEKPA